jgi:hypothetical protein
MDFVFLRCARHILQHQLFWAHGVGRVWPRQAGRPSHRHLSSSVNHAVRSPKHPRSRQGQANDTIWQLMMAATDEKPFGARTQPGRPGSFSRAAARGGGSEGQ